MKRAIEEKTAAAAAGARESIDSIDLRTSSPFLKKGPHHRMRMCKQTNSRFDRPAHIFAFFKKGTSSPDAYV